VTHRALSALDDLAVEPTGDQLAAVLPAGMGPWSSLETWLAESAGVDGWEWGSTGKKYGWALRGKKGKRNLVYMIPQHGSFLVGLVLGDRAMEALRSASLSAAAREVLASAKRYGEGTGFRLPVASPADLEDVKTLIQIKLGHC